MSFNWLCFVYQWVRSFKALFACVVESFCHFVHHRYFLILSHWARDLQFFSLFFRSVLIFVCIVFFHLSLWTFNCKNTSFAGFFLMMFSNSNFCVFECNRKFSCVRNFSVRKFCSLWSVTLDWISTGNLVMHCFSFKVLHHCKFFLHLSHLKKMTFFSRKRWKFGFFKNFGTFFSNFTWMTHVFFEICEFFCFFTFSFVCESKFLCRWKFLVAVFFFSFVSLRVLNLHTKSKLCYVSVFTFFFVVDSCKIHYARNFWWKSNLPLAVRPFLLASRLSLLEVRSP